MLLGEGNVLKELLEKSDLNKDSKYVNLHFVYLLQRSKFNEGNFVNRS